MLHMKLSDEFAAFDDDRKSISGTWEMTVQEEKYFDDDLEEIVTGTFEMRRIT